VRTGATPAGTYHFTDNMFNIPPRGIRNQVPYSISAAPAIGLSNYLLLPGGTILEGARTEPARWGLAFAREVDR